MVNDRIQFYINYILSLISSEMISFNDNIHGIIPTSGGIYRIFEIGADWSNSVYVGKSNNLRNRIYTNLLKGNSESHTLIRKLTKMDSDYSNVEDVRIFLRQKCLFQFLQISDERQRCFTEHFTISILKPEYND